MELMAFTDGSSRLSYGQDLAVKITSNFKEPTRPPRPPAKSPTPAFPRRWPPPALRPGSHNTTGRHSMFLHALSVNISEVPQDERPSCSTAAGATAPGSLGWAGQPVFTGEAGSSSERRCQKNGKLNKQAGPSAHLSASVRGSEPA